MSAADKPADKPAQTTEQTTEQTPEQLVAKIAALEKSNAALQKAASKAEQKAEHPGWKSAPDFIIEFNEFNASLPPNQRFPTQLDDKKLVKFIPQDDTTFFLGERVISNDITINYVRKKMSEMLLGKVEAKRKRLESIRRLKGEGTEK